MYLIVGANGFVGNYFLKNILENTSDSIIAADLNIPTESNIPRIKWEKTDITSLPDLQSLYEKTKSQKLKIIFLAAYSHPDNVLKNPRIAWKINIIALANFLNIFNNVEAFYYPSTEVVYGQGIDGYKFKETDKLNPSNKYGEHKSIAERMVNVCGYNIVRFPVLMGPSLIEGKKHFYDEIVDTLKSGNKIEMFTDNLRTMLDFDTASSIVIKLIETSEVHKYPIVNISGDEAISKYEFAVRIAEKYNLNKSNIIPISMDNDNKIFTANRAKETLIDNTLVKKILNLNELKIKV